MKSKKMTEEQKEMARKEGIDPKDYRVCYEDDMYIHLIDPEEGLRSVRMVRKK